MFQPDTVFLFENAGDGEEIFMEFKMQIKENTQQASLPVYCAIETDWTN